MPTLDSIVVGGGGGCGCILSRLHLLLWCRANVRSQHRGVCVPASHRFMQSLVFNTSTVHAARVVKGSLVHLLTTKQSCEHTLSDRSVMASLNSEQLI